MCAAAAANAAIFVHLLGAFQVWMQPLYGASFNPPVLHLLESTNISKTYDSGSLGEPSCMYRQAALCWLRFSSLKEVKHNLLNCPDVTRLGLALFKASRAMLDQ